MEPKGDKKIQTEQKSKTIYNKTKDKISKLTRIEEINKNRLNCSDNIILYVVNESCKLYRYKTNQQQQKIINTTTTDNVKYEQTMGLLLLHYSSFVGILEL